MATREEPVERKVQLTGGSTYTVSLPKEWASERGIEAGSAVRLFSREDRLVIADPVETSDRLAVTLDAADRTPESLARTVQAAYVAGCDIIRVQKLTERAQRLAMREAVTNLVGIEIHEESEDGIVARTMLDVDDLSAEQTLNQIELTAISMHESAIDALLGNDDELARRVIEQDDDVDRLFGLICRRFHLSLVDVAVAQRHGELTTFDYYTCARQLERIADHAAKIAVAAERSESSPPPELGEELGELAADARRIVQRARKALLDGDGPEAVRVIIEEAEALLAETEQLDRTLYESDHPETYRLGTVLDSIVRTIEHGINIAEAALQATMRNSRVDGTMRQSPP